jgi:GDP-L-fucose synthase
MPHYVHQVEKLSVSWALPAFIQNLPLSPLKKRTFLSGYLEATNQPYAVAKLSGIELCDAYRAQYGCDFISAMPANLYGPNDNYDLEKSHVLPALLRKFMTAKRNREPMVTIWGTGTPKREFLHVDDLARACLFLMHNYSEKGPLNVGVGEDLTILELAQMIRELAGYEGEIQLDHGKPDGTPRKLLDVSRINGLGWQASIGLKEGIKSILEELHDRF